MENDLFFVINCLMFSQFRRMVEVANKVSLKRVRTSGRKRGERRESGGSENERRFT